MTTDRIRVALVGVGATGLEAGRAVLGREDAELVAGVRHRPGQGRQAAAASCCSGPTRRTCASAPTWGASRASTPTSRW